MAAADVLDAAYAYRVEHADRDDRADIFIRAVIAAGGQTLDGDPVNARQELDRALGLLPEPPKELTLAELADRWGIA